MKQKYIAWTDWHSDFHVSSQYAPEHFITEHYIPLWLHIQIFNSFCLDTAPTGVYLDGLLMHKKSYLFRWHGFFWAFWNVKHKSIWLTEWVNFNELKKSNHLQTDLIRACNYNRFIENWILIELLTVVKGCVCVFVLVSTLNQFSLELLLTSNFFYICCEKLSSNVKYIHNILINQQQTIFKGNKNEIAI